MKNFIFFAIIVLVSCKGQNNLQPEDRQNDSTQQSSFPTGYDSLYAQALGADEYGMKTFVMALLSEGENQDLDSLEKIDLQRGHMDNINRLAEEGKLVLAGPFYNNPNSNLSGIYIFNVTTIAEAEELTMTDPAIQQGALKMELLLWYGSAALLEINDIHSKIAKENP